MKRILPIVLFLLVATGGFAESAGIDGTWKTTLQGPNGDMELTFVFKLVDGKLTGVVKSPNGDIAITNTKVNGNEFSFDVSFNDMTIKHDCALKEDDTIAMNVKGSPMGDLQMILKRQS